MSHQLFRGRYSLGFFLLVCTIAGPAIGLTVKHIWFREEYAVVTSQSDLNWVAMLDMGGSRHQVMFAVVFPKGSIYQYGTTADPRVQPSPKGVDISPRGLHWNGSKVPLGSARKLFVWPKDKKLELVPLTPEELQKFDEEFVADIPNNGELLNRILATGRWIPKTEEGAAEQGQVHAGNTEPTR